MRKLIRPKKGRRFAGVAIGLSNYLRIDVVVIRLIWILLFIPGGLPGLIPYLVCWLVIPEKRETF